MVRNATGRRDIWAGRGEDAAEVIREWMVRVETRMHRVRYRQAMGGINVVMGHWMRRG